MTIRTAHSFNDATRMLHDAEKELRQARRVVKEQESIGDKPDRSLLSRAEAALEVAREEVQRFKRGRPQRRRDERPIFGGDEC